MHLNCIVTNDIGNLTCTNVYKWLKNKNTKNENIKVYKHSNIVCISSEPLFIQKFYVY